MKSFLITTLLLGIMLAGVVANHIYIKEVFQTMTDALSALPDINAPDCKEQAARLAEYWERQSELVSLSVSYTTVDRINEQMAVLLACAEQGDLFGYRSAHALLLDAVGDMMRFEKPTYGALL